MALTLSSVVVAAMALHVHYGRHRILVINNRGVPIRSLDLRVVGERRALGPLPVGGMVPSRFRNPWPKDASLFVRIESADGSVEERECLFLGMLPQVSVVRLVAEGVECRNVGPAL